MTNFYDFTTYHSIVRAKERLGYNEKTSMNQIKHAMERGKKADQFKSSEYEYLAKRCDETKYAVAYNDFCYIMGTDGSCVTMFPLPEWFGKKNHFDGKKKIKKPKAYLRYNHDEDSEVWA